MKKTLQRLSRHILPLLVVAVVSFIIGVKYLNEPPAYVHAWAQADNYSLALGFQHNGYDLFHPQTLIYNKQQYGFEDPESLVTACDFPLHHWCASLLMGLTKSHQPWVFRSLTLVVAIIGLWALYLMTYVLTRSRSKSLLVSVVTATAPSFAYYSSSFLPTLPALTFAMCGLLFYVLHLRDNKNWTLYVSLLFLTLSAMVRTSFAVLWIAVACFQTLRILRHETSLKSSWLPFFAGALLFASWWFWSMHLREQYGSLFLGSLLPVKSWDDAKIVLQGIHDLWRFHYYQRIQHWLYVVVAIGVLVTSVFKWRKTPNTSNRLSLWWLLAIWLFGEILFAIAMSQQYYHHDYYFLDSFFLPIIMLLIGLLTLLPNPTTRWVNIPILAVVLVLTGFMTAEALHMQIVRRSSELDAYQTAMRYSKANQMLEDNGFGSRELRFLTLFAYPQNLPFVMMDREGYAVMRNKPEVVEHALTFDYDYILVEDEIYRRNFDEAQYILPRLQRLAGNGEISVCTLSDSVLHPDAEHFFTSTIPSE